MWSDPHVTAPPALSKIPFSTQKRRHILIASNNNGTWDAKSEGESDRIKDPTVLVLCDLGSVEPNEVGPNVWVGGVRGRIGVGRTLEAEWDLREEEEEGEDEGYGVGPL